MPTITITAQQSRALLEELDGVIGGKMDMSSSPLQVLELERQHPAEFELLRGLHGAEGDEITVEVDDVPATMRAVLGVLTYHDGGAEDTFGGVIDGPVCLEDANGFPERVEDALTRLNDDAQTRQLFIEVLAELALKRAEEVEFRPDARGLRHPPGAARVHRGGGLMATRDLTVVLNPDEANAAVQAIYLALCAQGEEIGGMGPCDTPGAMCELGRGAKRIGAYADLGEALEWIKHWGFARGTPIPEPVTAPESVWVDLLGELNERAEEVGRVEMDLQDVFEFDAAARTVARAFAGVELVAG